VSAAGDRRGRARTFGGTGMTRTVAPRPFIVAATPRTGSNLLCEGLEATGIAGRPAEVFAPDFRPFYCRHWSISEDVSFPEYLAMARRHGMTPNGVYGLKIQKMHVAHLGREAGLVGEYFEGENDDVLELLVPNARYINIVRRDRRAQAISYYRALLSNEWVRRPSEEEQRRVFQLPPQHSGPLPFDARAIRDLERQLAQQQASWQRYFTKRDITPLVFEYEKIAGDYRGTIADALAFLELDASAAAAIPPPRLVRQADDLTDRWRERLEAHAG
jgi:LPS sulfotransferase NodH